MTEQPSMQSKLCSRSMSVSNGNESVSSTEMNIRPHRRHSLPTE